MHWVIQKSLFKPANFELLISALERAAIEFSVVSITPKTNEISPDLSIAGPVFVCGAIRLKAVAENKGWKPGSFLNENFSFDIWKEKLGTELLNSDTTEGTLRNIDVPLDESFFIRPLEDNKAFDGMVIDKETLDDWRGDKRKQSLMGLDVIVSTAKQIYREYRIFVVAGKAITGSTYKVGRRAEISELIDEDVYNYVEKIIQKWVPAESFVIDISLGPDGLKVIEFNNINSSGFYAINMDKYVQAVQQAYSEEPKTRWGKGKAIDELVEKYNYPYEDWMQDWPYEIAVPDEFRNYLQHYDEQSDEDKKFVLMQMLIQALDDVEDEESFLENWDLLKTRITSDFKISEYTIYKWCCFDEHDLSLCWRVTPLMRNLWREIIDASNS